jgi:hypothetical protein
LVSLFKRKHGLRGFENRVPGMRFGLKRKEVKRQMYNENLNIYILLLTKYYLGDDIMKDKTDRLCGTYRSEEKCTEGCGGQYGM